MEEEKQYYSWLAGLIDGDGCFSLPLNFRKTNKGKEWINVGCQVRIGLKANDDWLVKEICAITKLGHIYYSNKGKENSVCYWQTTSWSDAVVITRRILPYLKLKRSKAEQFLAIAEKWTSNCGLGVNVFDRVAGKPSRPKELLLEMAKISTSINFDRQTNRYRDYKNFEYWKEVIERIYRTDISE